jgi:hypothetical protein
MESILPCCLPYGKAGGLQLLRCQGIAVGYYGFTLDAGALKPSDFCSVEVESGDFISCCGFSNCYSSRRLNIYPCFSLFLMTPRRTSRRLLAVRLYRLLWNRPLAARFCRIYANQGRDPICCHLESETSSISSRTKLPN